MYEFPTHTHSVVTEGLGFFVCFTGVLVKANIKIKIIIVVHPAINSNWSMRPIVDIPLVLASSHLRLFVHFQ